MSAPVAGAIGSGTTSASLGVPTGVTSGSLVVAFTVAWWSGTTAKTPSNMTGPSGFEAGPYVGAVTNGSYYTLLTWWYKYATGADTGTYAFTATGAAQTEGYAALMPSGSPTSGSPFSDSGHGAVSSTEPVSVGAFTPPNDTLVLTGLWDPNGSTTFGEPSGTSYTRLIAGTAPSGYADGMAVYYWQQTTGTPAGGSWPNAGGALSALIPISVPVTASLAATLPPLTAYLTTTNDVTASLVATLPPPTSALEASSTMAASLSAELPAITAVLRMQPQATTWWNALHAAQAGSSNARVWVVGDSVLEGQGSTTRANRSQEKFITGSRTQYGIPGTGGGLFRVFSGGSEPWAPPTSANNNVVPNGWFSTQGQLGGDWDATGDYVEWTVTGTSIDVVALQDDGSGGSITVAVDGATVTTINTGSSGTLTLSVPTRVSLGAAGSHVVRITSTGTAAVDGIVVYDGDENDGITWWDATHYGWGSPDFATSDAGATITAAGTNLQPHLIIDGLTGTGDYNNGGIPMATFQADLAARISAYQAMPDTPTVLFMNTYYVGAQATTPDSQGNTAADYHNAVKTAAAAAGMLVCDLNDVYPTFASNDGWLAADDGHPSDIGHAAIATALLQTVTPEPVTGTLTATIPANTGSLVGEISNPARAAAELGVVTGTLNAQQSVPARVAATLLELVPSLHGALSTPGTLAAVLPSLTCDLHDQALTTGILNAMLPAVVSAIAATQTTPALLAGVLPELTCVLNDSGGPPEIPSTRYLTGTPVWHTLTGTPVVHTLEGVIP